MKVSLIFPLIIPAAFLLCLEAAYAEEPGINVSALCALSGQQSRDWGTQDLEIGRAQAPMWQSPDFLKGPTDRIRVGRIVNRNPFVLDVLPELPLAHEQTKGTEDSKSLLSFSLWESTKADYGIREEESEKLKDAHFGALIQGIDTRRLLCGNDEIFEPGTKTRMPAPEPSKPALGDIKLLKEAEYLKQFHDRPRLERSMASGTLLSVLWSTNERSAKFAIFQDGMAAVSEFQNRTFVYNKLNQTLIKNLFQALGESNIESAVSDWSHSKPGSFMTVVCARAQRIDISAFSKFDSHVSAALDALYTSLVESAPATIHYDRAMPVKKVSWPKDLLALDTIVRDKLSGDRDKIGKLGQTKIPENLWNLIPSSQTSLIVNRDAPQKQHKNEVRLFFKSAEGIYAVERASCSQNSTTCVPQSLHAIHIHEMKSGFAYGLGIWPQDLKMPLRETKNRRILIPKEVFLSNKLAFESLANVRAGSTFVSGDTLFEGVRYSRMSVAD